MVLKNVFVSKWPETLNFFFKSLNNYLQSFLGQQNIFLWKRQMIYILILAIKPNETFNAKNEPEKKYFVEIYIFFFLCFIYNMFFLYGLPYKYIWWSLMLTHDDYWLYVCMTKSVHCMVKSYTPITECRTPMTEVCTPMIKWHTSMRESHTTNTGVLHVYDGVPHADDGFPHAKPMMKSHYAIKNYLKLIIDFDPLMIEYYKPIMEFHRAMAKYFECQSFLIQKTQMHKCQNMLVQLKTYVAYYDIY